MATASRTRRRYSVVQPGCPNQYTLPDDACTPCRSLAPNITTAAPGSNAFACDWSWAGQLKKSGRASPVEMW